MDSVMGRDQTGHPGYREKLVDSSGAHVSPEGRRLFDSHCYLRPGQPGYRAGEHHHTMQRTLPSLGSYPPTLPPSTASTRSRCSCWLVGECVGPYASAFRRYLGATPVGELVDNFTGCLVEASADRQGLIDSHPG